MDPPRHDELRNLLVRVLTPCRVAGLEPHVRAFADSLVDGYFGDGPSTPRATTPSMIPTITMCVLMDLPTSERAKFLKWNLDTLGGRRLHQPGGARGLRRDGRVLGGHRRRAPQRTRAPT